MCHLVSCFAWSHNDTSFDIGWPWSDLWPSFFAIRTTALNLLVNLSVAALRVASGSSFSKKHRDIAANKRSPTSSSSRALLSLFSKTSRTSVHSLWMESRIMDASGQQNPKSAAFCSMFFIFSKMFIFLFSVRLVTEVIVAQ